MKKDSSTHRATTRRSLQNHSNWIGKISLSLNQLWSCIPSVQMNIWRRTTSFSEYGSKPPPWWKLDQIITQCPITTKITRISRQEFFCSSIATSKWSSAMCTTSLSFSTTSVVGPEHSRSSQSPWFLCSSALRSSRISFLDCTTTTQKLPNTMTKTRQWRKLWMMQKQKWKDERELKHLVSRNWRRRSNISSGCAADSDTKDRSTK